MAFRNLSPGFHSSLFKENIRLTRVVFPRCEGREDTGFSESPQEAGWSMRIRKRAFLQNPAPRLRGLWSRAPEKGLRRRKKCRFDESRLWP